MAKPASKEFDCVRSMRETRDRLSQEIADMKYDELVAWLRTYRYSDPFLRQLAEAAAQRAAAADAAMPRR